MVWNCSRRLHDKVPDLLRLRPDVAVLAECACPEVLLRRLPPRTLGAGDLLWAGTEPSRGLGVATFGAWRGACDPAHDRSRRGATLPVQLTGPAAALHLLAVWARPGAEPLRAAIQRHAPFLTSTPTIVAGDFNATLARSRRLAAELAALGFRSAYHHLHRVAPGEESEPTFFRLRRYPSRHHLDLVFVDAATAEAITRVEVHVGARWSAWSDHVPVVVELECNSNVARPDESRSW
ncbi:MAG TPA: hypothetical protein VJS92_05795 [Candidatus Polarisedimenticolaceae bacterium]|nr:hypothetical protein [Candidatus Polarisedimenticolaceae bacterium]